MICLTDINECEEGISGCSQLCNNTVGGYFCSCMAGYSLLEDGTHTHTHTHTILQILMSVPLAMVDVNTTVSTQWEVLSAGVLVDMLWNQMD